MRSGYITCERGGNNHLSPLNQWKPVTSENAHSLVAAIWSEAKRLGVADRVRVLQSGKLSDLTKFSSGMLVINSTSAFSALHHHVPVLVLGDAIFRHSSVVTVGNGADSIKAFMKCREAKPPQNITAFINAVKAKALLPGDFYALSAQSETARNVVATVERIVGESAGTGITRK